MEKRKTKHDKESDFATLKRRYLVGEMNIKNVNYGGEKPHRLPFDVSEKEIDNSLYNKERSKRRRRTIVEYVGRALIIGGVASALAYAVYRGKSY